MAIWEQSNIVITSVGRTLLSNAQLGKGRIKITRILARENFETTASAMRSYTLSNIPESSIAQEGHILSTQIAVTHPDPEQEVETSLLTVRFSNDELADKTKSYNLRQIIVMARLVDINSDDNLPYADDLGEVPYMVAQCSNQNEPDLMPPRQDNPTSLDYDIYVIHSGVPTITIEVRTSGYVFVDVYNADKTEIWTSINELKDNAVGQNTRDKSFDLWTPVYSDSRNWSSESTGETATGQKSSERFNTYDENNNIVIGDNSSAFGYGTEVLGSQSAAFGFNNYVGSNASQSFVIGAQNAIRDGSQNFVSGLNNEVVSGSSNNVSGALHYLEKSERNTVSGMKNALYTVTSSAVFGDNNKVQNTSFSVIGGWTNDIGSATVSPNTTTFTLAVGYNVRAEKGLSCSLVVGDDISVNTTSSANNVLLFGKGISVDSDGSHIIGNSIIFNGSCIDTFATGTSHEVSASQSAFVSGNTNVINSSIAAAAFNYHNTINGSIHSAAFGFYNTINGGENTVIYGIQNTVNISNHALIGGYVNNVSSSPNVLVSGANHNVNSANNSVIFGNANTVSPNDTESLIGGNNSRVSHTSRSVIVGDNLTVDWASESSIHGINNRVYGERQTHSNLIAGNSNIIHNDGGLGNADNGKSVIVGTNNEVVDYSDSALSGSDNKIQNIMESSVTGKYITIYTIANQSRSIGVRNCDISGYNSSVTQFENSVITGTNHTLSDYKPNNVAGEWNLNSCNNLIGGDSTKISGIYSSAVVGFGHEIENIHDSIIGGRSNIISGGNTAAGGTTNSIVAVGQRLNITNSQSPQAVFGRDNTVKGGNILVTGRNLIASSNDSITAGRFNAEDTSNNYALVVGGGTSDTNRSNIMTLDWSGNLHIHGLYVSDIKNEDGTAKDFGGGSTNVQSGSGNQSVVMNDVSTNKATGLKSTALGNNNTASGENSLAIGNTTSAQGLSSIAAGDNTKTTSDYSLVGGYASQCIYSSESTIVWGRSCTATYSPQTALFGYSNIAARSTGGLISGINNVIGSENANVTNNGSAILGGEDNQVISNHSVTIGGQRLTVNSPCTNCVIVGGFDNHFDNPSSTNFASNAIILGGYGLISRSPNSVTMGTYNLPDDTTNDSDTTALVIGNGTSYSNRSNALRITKTGEIYTGDDTKSLNERIAELEAAVAALQGQTNSVDIYQQKTMSDGTTALLSTGHITSTTSDTTNIIGEVTVDTSDSLPTASTFDGYTLEQGSIAYTTDTSEFYVLDSNGEWNIQDL